MYYFKHTRIPSPSGERVSPVRKWQLQKDGSRELVVVGETDIYAKIQSAKDDCDIYKLLDRHAAGDFTALNLQAQRAYADITSAPKNIHEAVANVNKAKEHFFQLPVEIREAFGNDPRSFVEKSDNAEEFSKPFMDYFKAHGYEFKKVSDTPKGDDKGGEK